MTPSTALDLGSTWIKGARLEGARLREIVTRPAPGLSGDDPVRESDALAYLEAASTVLDDVLARAPKGVPLGLASQRSSFVLWERATGRPCTPLISWQDRRAAPWCDTHRGAEERVRRVTGLPLSPHYAGAKLAWLMQQSAALLQGLRRGRLLFGTLETFAVWHWTGGRTHETDLTMSARTLLADPGRGRWSPEMLDLFGVPAGTLPHIVPSMGRAIELASGARIAASLADQAASAVTVLGAPARERAAVVNLGTGGFVLRSTGERMELRPGYLAGPMLGIGPSRTLYAIEGTINGAAAAVDRFGSAPTELPADDPDPEAFAVPDVSGLGAPHWRPERTLSFSAAAAGLPEGARRRVVAEGVLFRVREILEDLFADAAPERVYLGGGLARDPFFPRGLAACLGRPIEILEASDGTLLGAALLAAGVAPGTATVLSSTIEPEPAGRYLLTKFPRWREWLRGLLQS
jgi:glycerol kinase